MNKKTKIVNDRNLKAEFKLLEYKSENLKCAEI